jgi:membrane-associated phospholipid phosphatase
MQTETALFSREDWVKMAIIGAIVAIDLCWIWSAGFTFDWASALRLLAVPVLLGVAELYRRWRPYPVFVTMTKETAWLLAFTASAALLSNLVITLGLPAIDNQIAAMDKALGFDWTAYYRFFAARPYVGLAASLLYVSTLPLIAFAVITLSLTQRVERAQELVLAAMIGAIIAITISGLLPAAGGLGHFRPEGVVLAHRPIVDLDYKQTFFDLRSGLVTAFSFSDMKGLIAFPSYHATLSVLVVLAFRGIPKFFWPLLVACTLILATTPVEGGHYLTDAIAGTIVAIVSVWIAAAWRRRIAGEPASTAAWLTTPSRSTVPGETA